MAWHRGGAQQTELWLELLRAPVRQVYILPFPSGRTQGQLHRHTQEIPKSLLPS